MNMGCLFLSPGVYFSRIDFVAIVYDGNDLYPIHYDAPSEPFVVAHFGEEYEVNIPENKVTRFKDKILVEERNIVAVSKNGVSFEPFKL